MENDTSSSSSFPLAEVTMLIISEVYGLTNACKVQNKLSKKQTSNSKPYFKAVDPWQVLKIVCHPHPHVAMEIELVDQMNRHSS